MDKIKLFAFATLMLVSGFERAAFAQCNNNYTPVMLVTSFGKATFTKYTANCAPNSTLTCTPVCTPLDESFGTTAGCAATTVQSSSTYPGVVNMTNTTYSGGNNNTDAPNDGEYAVRCSNSNGWNGQWFDATKGMTDADGVAGGNFLVVNAGAESFGSTASGYHPYEFYHKNVTVCPGAVYTISYKAGNLSTYNSGNPNSCSYGGEAALQMYVMPGGTAVQPTVVAGVITNYNGSGGTLLDSTGSMDCVSTGFVWNTYSKNYTVPAGQTSLDVVLLSSYLKAAGNDFAVDDIKVTYVSGAGSCSGTSPIELMSFTAEKTPQNILLKWSTATEENFSHFVIERSTDAVNFQQIGIVYGSGNSKHEIDYTYTDNSANQGAVYYRLKQVDIDGTFKYSPVSSVNVDITSPVFIYPSDGDLTIQFTAKGEATYTIIDMIGKTIYSGTRISDESIITINKSNFRTGVYIVKVQMGTEMVAKKIVLN
jgi:hypothetical protein